MTAILAVPPKARPAAIVIEDSVLVWHSTCPYSELDRVCVLWAGKEPSIFLVVLVAVYIFLVEVAGTVASQKFRMAGADHPIAYLRDPLRGIALAVLV